MNDIQCIIDRQLGLCGHFNYDNILRRLAVSPEESYYGLQNGPVVVGPGDADPPIFACRFAEAPGYEHILALANEDGRVAIQDTSKVGSPLEGFQCHNNAVFDLAWMPEEMSFVTVSGDHTACVWAVGAGGARRVCTLAGHERSVKAAAWRARDLLATGGRDGHVLLWDTRAGAAPVDVIAPDQALVHIHATAAARTPGSHGKRRGASPAWGPPAGLSPAGLAPAGLAPSAPRAASVTALAVVDHNTLVSAGEVDGLIKVWDLRKHYSAWRRARPRHELRQAGGGRGCSSLAAGAGRLYAACLDGGIYCYSAAAWGPPLMRHAGHRCGSFYVRAALSPDGRYLASGSSDAAAYVWSTRAELPLLRLGGHRAEVTCVALARAGPLLATAGDDARHRLWRLHAGRDRCERAEWLPARTQAPRRAKRCLADRLEAAPPPAKRARAASPAGESPRKRRSSPEVARCRAVAARSPGKVVVVEELPDWVREGAAPHLRLSSPRRPRAPPRDWLTQLRRQRAAPPPAPVAPVSPAPPVRPRHARTLLSYFTQVSTQPHCKFKPVPPANT